MTAAVRAARRHGLRVEDPAVLHDTFSVRAHLRRAPVVARVPTWSALCLAGLRDTVADVPGWDDGLRWALDSLARGRED